MDISVRYISMCEKANDIQGRWKCEYGDWVYWKKEINMVKVGIRVVGSNIIKFDSNKYVYFCTGRNECDDVEREDIIWLPRQDQLQDMIMAMFNPYIHLDEFHRFADENFHHESLEQIWLVFTMNHISKKDWDETKQDWIGREV